MLFSFFLFAAVFADEVTDCAVDKPCDPVHTYSLQYAFGDQTVPVVCKNEQDWFSKTAFSLLSLSDGNFQDHCRASGYDGVGKIMRAVPTNIAPNTLTNPTDIMCNARYEVFDVDVEKPKFSDEHATWQCIDHEPVVECCFSTHFKAKCYNNRGTYNNFVACRADDCASVCDNSRELDEACITCCRNEMIGEWKCNAELTPALVCKRASESKKVCKKALHKTEGKCKYVKGKKSEDGRCKLKVFYGNCEDLRKRDCKKAVAARRCSFADATEKSCKPIDLF